MNKLKALSLIETILFISLLGLITSLFLPRLLDAFQAIPTLREHLQARELARSRMEILIGQARHNFASFDDICTLAAPPPACPTIPEDLTIQTTIQAWSLDSRFKQITVEVTGRNSITLSTLVTAP